MAAGGRKREELLARLGTLEAKEAALRGALAGAAEAGEHIRPRYSSPPIHGALIVDEVLGDEQLRAQYYTECEGMAEAVPLPLR